MANYSGSLCLMLQPRMELNCIAFSSAKACQASSKMKTTTTTTAAASKAHLRRRNWEVVSGLSGSNLMIRKELGHRKTGDDDTERHTPHSCCCAISSPSQRGRCNLSMQVIADRGSAAATATTAEEENALIQEVAKEREKVEYNWEEEWYPMYLTAEMPTNSPLGLKVFDRSLVLFYDGQGKINCFEDRCPHRLAKLSEGQIMDGNLECLYHGWQFNGVGTCIKIPQLAPGAKIPKTACARSYEVRESQGVIWVWLSQKTPGDPKKLPWFEHFAKEGFADTSSVHELPYDYSILLENLMDPAHIPISHDRTDINAKRENAKALVFEVTERTSRGFSGKWGEIGSPTLPNTTRFEAPCCLRNDKEVVKDGKTEYYSALFLCRPAGQGKSMLILRFGGTNLGQQLRWFPSWLLHMNNNTVFEQDMGFLSSQNETLVRKNVATKDLYLNLKSLDTWVTEYRKWLDLTGHGMPYYFGHRTVSQSPNPAIAEAAPAGLVAATASSYPAKGSFGAMFARDPTNRYFRHVVHCKSCLRLLNSLKKFQKIGVVLGALCTGVAITLSTVAWRATFVALALLMFASAYACTQGVATLTQNFVRPHRR